MKNRTLTTKLSKNQAYLIKNFLLQHNITYDFRDGFGLIAEPKVDTNELVIKLLSIDEMEKLGKIYKKMGLLRGQNDD